jgi:cytidyltransferase-like protein
MIYGCVHGRFQPFHKGHFEYLEAARAQCDQLIVGITQYEQNLVDPESPEHRVRDAENPFSYWERCQIIWSIIDAAAIPRKKMDIVPFPIHAPANVRSYVPAECIMFTTIFDEWNRRKVMRLEGVGFRVVVLWERAQKEFEGRIVRQAFKVNRAEAQGMVPAGAFETICKLLDNSPADSTMTIPKE